MFLKKIFKKKEQPEIQTAAIAPVADFSELYGHFTEIKDRLRKMENKQKEMSLQLDEINGFLQDGDDSESNLINSIVAATDNIETFYRFAAENENQPLFEQADMMWKSAKNAAEAAGLEIIDEDHAPFDFQRHSTESVGCDENIPSGYIIKVLKCGYTYRGMVMRRAAVEVNKI